MMRVDDTRVMYGTSWTNMYQHPQGNHFQGSMPIFDYNMQPPWEHEQMHSNAYSYGSDSNPYQFVIQEPEPTVYDSMIEPSPFTAVGKRSIFSDIPMNQREEYPMRQWSPQDVIFWLCEEARKQGYDFEKIYVHNFQNVNGEELLAMNEQQFLSKCSDVGYMLYEAVQRYKKFEEERERLRLPVSHLTHFGDLNTNEPDRIEITDISHYKPVDSYTHAQSDDSQSDSSYPDMVDIKPDRKTLKSPTPRKPGRPPKMGRTKRGNKEKKTGRLWEFIRDLLKKPEYCPSLICWENHDEGVFRFVRSDKVAELWGTIKENPRMTYEKLSRAMRYYYKSKVLQPVLGRRLVYKFGPTARDWRSPDPNFRNSSKKAHDVGI